MGMVVVAADKEAPAGKHAVAMLGNRAGDAVEKRHARERLLQARLQVRPQVEKRGDEHVAGNAAQRIEMDFEHDGRPLIAPWGKSGAPHRAPRG